MSAYRQAAPAKVNLSLEVAGRRADGFHDIRSLVVFADGGDVLTATEAARLTLEVTGPFRQALAGEENNLVLKAAERLRVHLGVSAGAHLTLEKNLPVASGIGGGSADAAAALRLLCALYERRVAPHELAALALDLGADVPVCLEAAPAMMWGKGERIARLSALPDFWMVLANPGVALSTAAVFSKLAAPPLAGEPGALTVPAFDDFDALIGWLVAHGNDLERPAIALAPVIAEVMAALKATPACRLARMSGSGATCFGLYHDEASARRAETTLRAAQPQWWVAAARRL
jgi:4-diphosphocytidyl-2-C-methyl-D-erythritol kinase